MSLIGLLTLAACGLQRLEVSFIKPAIAGDLDAKGTIKHHREWWCLNPSAVNLCFAASNPWKPLFILDPSIIKPHKTLPPNL